MQADDGDTLQYLLLCVAKQVAGGHAACTLVLYEAPVMTGRKAPAHGGFSFTNEKNK